LRHYLHAREKGASFRTGFYENVIGLLIEAAGVHQVSAPSHDDLHRENILVTGEEPPFIDWSEATWDEPFSDVGEPCLLSQLSLEQEKLFLRVYLGKEPGQNDMERLKKTKGKVCLFISCPWFRLAERRENQNIPEASRIALLDAKLKQITLKNLGKFASEDLALSCIIVTEIKTFKINLNNSSY
jgi:hypothetical protein